MTRTEIINAIRTGEITRWGSTLSDNTVLVRDDADAGGNTGFSWSTDGERWYASAYHTVREAAAAAHGCSTGIATRTDGVHSLGLYGGEAV